MQLADFDRVERGPRRFDAWESRQSVPSPVGDFKIEFQVDMDAHPTLEMLAAAERLLARFEQDKELLTQRIFDNYLAVCADPYASDWLEDCRVSVGLSLAELSKHLDPRTLTVDTQLNMSVYTSPDWDREHGLYFDLIDDEWVFNE